MSRPSRRQIAEAVLLMINKRPMKQVSEALANYLVANRRSKELDSIMRDIESLRKQREGVVEATAVSAYELDDTIKRTLLAMLGSHKSHITYRRDPGVVGGVRLSTLDWQLDTTIETKLKRLTNINAVSTER